MEDLSNIITVKDRVNYIDVEANTIVLFDIIDNATSAAIVANMWRLAKSKQSPIRILINSHGGYLSDTQAIIASLVASGAVIFVDIVGVAYSGAAMIALCGDHIKMSKLGMYMLHYPDWELERRSLPEHETDIGITKEWFERTMKFLLTTTKFDFNEFKKRAKVGDVYLTPSQCLKLEMVSEVY